MKNLVLLILFAFFLFDTGNAPWPTSNGAYGGTVMDILVFGSDVYAGTRGGGIFRSTNNGETWTALNNGLDNPYVNAFAVSGSTIFAGTTITYGGIGGGVYRSTDNGATWVNVSSGLSSIRVNGLAARSEERRVGKECARG